jgi:hypothetical protein
MEMTLVLELSSEIEAALQEEAERQGTTPELLAVKMLRDRFAPQNGNGQKAAPLDQQSAYEALKPFIGMFNSSKVNQAEIPQSDDPHEIAFGEIMDEKYRRQGFTR